MYLAAQEIYLKLDLNFEVINVRCLIGRNFIAQAKFTEALSTYTELDGFIDKLPVSIPMLASSMEYFKFDAMDGINLCEFEIGDKQKAIETSYKTLSLKKQKFGDSMLVAEHCSRLCIYLALTGKPDDAEKLIAEGIDLITKIYGPNSDILSAYVQAVKQLMRSQNLNFKIKGF